MATFRTHKTLAGAEIVCVLALACICVWAGDQDTIEEVCEQLQAGTVADETALIQEKLVPLGQPVIDAMIERLQAPMVSETNGLTVMNDDAFPVVQVLAQFGDTGYNNLLEHVTETNAFFRANVLGALSHWDKSESFPILTNALNDVSLAYPGDSRGAPPRICDQAYRTLWNKIEDLGFTPPYRISLFTSFDEATRDGWINHLKLWWGTNETAVMEEFSRTFRTSQGAFGRRDYLRSRGGQVALRGHAK